MRGRCVGCVVIVLLCVRYRHSEPPPNPLIQIERPSPFIFLQVCDVAIVRCSCKNSVSAEEGGNVCWPSNRDSIDGCADTGRWGWP